MKGYFVNDNPDLERALVLRTRAVIKQVMEIDAKTDTFEDFGAQVLDLFEEMDGELPHAKDYEDGQ